MTATDPAARIAEAVDRIGPLDTDAMAAAQERLDRLTKPPGSLGRLEELVVTLAGITGQPGARLDHRQIVVVAADHGVARRGVSAYPSEVTAQMVRNFVAGGAAVNVLAESVGAAVTVVDVGVAATVTEPGPAEPRGGRLEPRPAVPRGGRLVRARIRDGTADMTSGPAMHRSEALRAIVTGIALVEDLRDNDGLDVLAVGDMGIGNTTAASAMTAALTGERADRVTGRGTGVGDDGLRRKLDAIERALAVNEPDPADPLGVLAAVGGLEIATIVGLLLGAAANRVPVILDGFITGAAALVGAALQPALVPRLIAAHRSPEPGHDIILQRLGIRPLLDLDLRLGEGSGAVIAMGLLVTACRIRDGMATFETAGISGPAS